MITPTAGQNSLVHGIRVGYANGDLAFQANMWAGTANAGEFGITGTSFTPNDVASPVTYEVYVRDSTMVTAATNGQGGGAGGGGH